MVVGSKLKVLRGFNSLQERIQNNEWSDYDFSNSVYINNKTKLIVSCEVHGEFWIRPNDLTRGSGCAKCSTEVAGKKLSKTPQDYLQELEVTFPDYEVLGDYINNKTKILHRHKVCGYEWETRPNSIISGQGCPKCFGNTLKTSQDYHAELEEHFPEYEVLESYQGNKVKILHKHKTCGYVWKIKPNHILIGRGCPKCASYGFDPTLPAILYYLSVKQGEAYKIGITNFSVKQRYSNKELQDIEIIEEWKFEDGQEAYNLEQIILKSYKHLKYEGKDLLKSGNTEMFKEDILIDLRK